MSYKEAAELYKLVLKEYKENIKNGYFEGLCDLITDLYLREIITQRQRKFYSTDLRLYNAACCIMLLWDREDSESRINYLQEKIAEYEV